MTSFETGRDCHEDGRGMGLERNDAICACFTVSAEGCRSLEWDVVALAPAFLGMFSMMAHGPFACEEG